MKKHFYPLAALLALLLQALTGHAQYTTPQQDGIISASEYSGNVSKVSDAGSWYMTWDATNLYVAKTGGQNFEPVIMYLDLDPKLPVTSGDNTNGNTLGNNDFGVTPTLPFRADTRVYFTDTYIEVRRLDGLGGWGTPLTQDLSVSRTGSNREIKLSWATLTGGGGIPVAFNWLGYEVNQSSGINNFRYDQAPLNPLSQGTTGGATPPIEFYYTIASTANGNATNPFILKSYTFPGRGSNNAFGSIEVWDFTMNTPDQQISRGQTAGNWLISGSLVVGAGAVLFGNSSTASDFGTTNVGNIRVTGGILSMNATDKPINVREDIDLRGGQFILSGREGGDLNVGRDFLVTNGVSSPGTFQPNVRTVTFTGTNVAHTIRSTNAAPGYVIPFNYLALNTPGGTVTLNSSVFIINQVTFSNGNLVTGSNVVDLDANAQLTPEQPNSHLIGLVRITQPVGGGGAGTQNFGSIGFSLTPQNSSAPVGNVTVTRTTGTALTGVGSTGNSVQRYFTLDGPGLNATNISVRLQVGYRLDELNGISESTLALYGSATGAAPFTRLTTPPSADYSNHTISTDLTQLADGAVVTFGDGATPLPVTLVSFSAKATAQGAALLRWVTATELHNRGFGIERQLSSGLAWQSVGFVAATGQPVGSTYEFTDKSLATAAMTSPLAYYRLRQEDQDGTITYSPVAVVTRQAALATSELQLSPVPVTGSSLSVALAEAGQAGLEVAITNTQGQRLLHFTTQASTDAALSLPVAQLAAGVYIVTVQVPGQAVRHARFVKL
jgi:hypothetical protein